MKNQNNNTFQKFYKRIEARIKTANCLEDLTYRKWKGCSGHFGLPIKANKGKLISYNYDR